MPPDNSTIKKSSVSAITTVGITSITSSTAVSGGKISTINGAFIASGVCWGTQPHPVVTSGNVASNFLGASSFTSNITNLSGGLTYYVRSFVTSNVGITYGDELSFTTVTPPIKVGESYGGGIIFYVDSTKLHGLAAAPVDEGVSIAWDNGNYKYIPTLFTTPTALGTGRANTTAILNALGLTGDYAALRCKNLVYNGFSDWYLPSRDELHLMKLNLYNANIGNFTNTGVGYWSSSTDSSSGDFLAYSQDITDDNYVLTNISTFEAVRAIRAF